MRTSRIILRTKPVAHTCPCCKILRRLGFDRLKTPFTPRVAKMLWSLRSLHVFGRDATATHPKPGEFTARATELPSWETIVASANEVVKAAEERLSAAACEFNVTGRMDDLKSTLHSILATSSEIRGHMSELTQQGLPLNRISDELGVMFGDILAHIGKTFPLSDQAPSQTERLEMVIIVLEKAKQGFLDLAHKYDMSEAGLESVRESFSLLMPHIEHLVVITGDLIEENPVLFSTLICSVTGILVPEAWILRPLLSVMGYGLYGPVKGTPAAWAQFQFWGAAVKKGSWFAILQKAGMKGVSSSIRPVMGAIGGTIGALYGKLFR
ncbi:hypothetical protein BJ322DRAFT_1034738 [Thelephora terrestris]|uniref:Uncharacterized protein n=1 Tax=Thelephora terrestris TaxID=56493 RepID=A0A9P6HRL1_9AGAM|nr:hypothetical protein BJ322DRAFT_1034738 [Thelephora terrestris]